MNKLVLCGGCKKPIAVSTLTCEGCGTENKKALKTPWWFWLIPITVVTVGIYLKAQDEHEAIHVFGMRIENFAFIVCIAGFFFLIWSITKSKKQKQTEMAATLTSLTDFKSSKQFLGCDGKSGLAVDETRGKISLVTHDGRKASQRIVSYRDILSAELFEDGGSVTRTSRSSQMGGAFVGGLLLGGTGTIIGGLSGKTKTSATIRQIDLRLVVNDTTAPLHDVAFLNLEVAKGGMIYNGTNQVARSWLGFFKILIQRAESEENESRDRKIQVRPVATCSVADEIKKLSDLVKSGALTIEEFNGQKARLLGVKQSAARSDRREP
jgi:hypothetical protein